MARKNKNLGMLNLYVTHVDDTARKAAAYLIYVIEQKKDKAIKEAMQRRILWFKPMTRSEATAYVNRSPNPHDCYIPDWFVEELHLDTCNTLIETCIYLREHNYARMSVDLEKMHMISKLAIGFRTVPLKLKDEMLRAVGYPPLSEITHTDKDTKSGNSTKKVKQADLSD